MSMSSTSSVNRLSGKSVLIATTVLDPTRQAANFQVHTPSKRRRVISQDDLPKARDRGNTKTEPPSLQELWKWTLTQDAVAPCRVRDVFALKENGGGKGASNHPTLSSHKLLIRESLNVQTRIFFGWAAYHVGV